MRGNARRPSVAAYVASGALAISGTVLAVSPGRGRHQTRRGRPAAPPGSQGSSTTA